MSETAGAKVEPFAVNGFKIDLKDGARLTTTNQYSAELCRLLPLQPFPLDAKAPDVRGLTLAEVGERLYKNIPGAMTPEEEPYRLWNTEGHITRARNELSEQGYYIYLKRNPGEEEGHYYIREELDTPLKPVEMVAISNALLSHEGVKAFIGTKKTPLEFHAPEDIKKQVLDITERQQQRDVAEDPILVPERRKMKMEAYQKGRVVAAKKLKWLAEHQDRDEIIAEDYSNPEERQIVTWLTDPTRQEDFSGHFYKFLADQPLTAAQMDLDYKNFGIKEAERVWLSGRV